MSVSSVLDITNKAYAAKSGRFYDLYVDGQIFDPQGTLNPGVKTSSTVESLKPLVRDEYSLTSQYVTLPRS